MLLCPPQIPYRLPGTEKGLSRREFEKKNPRHYSAMTGVSEVLAQHI